MSRPPSQPPAPRGALDAVAAAAMLVFGIIVALLGAVMPILSSRLALGLGDVGTLFLAMNGAMLAASLLVGPSMDRFGMKAPLAIGILLAGGSLASIAAVPGFGPLLAAVACLGFGGGILNAGTNTLVADLHDDPDAKASALNLLGVFYGIGALLLPFGVGALVARVGLPALLLGAAALCLVIAVAAVALPFPAAKQAQGWPIARAGRFLRMPFVLAAAFLLFFESGNEFVLGGYFATFLTQALALPAAAASYPLAAYWAAILLGRLALSRGLLARVGAHTAVMAGALLALAGALAVAFAPSLPVAVLGIVLTGLALAGIFPTVLGIAGARFPDHSGTVFGILFTVGLTGGMTMPWLAGHLAAWAGLRPVFALVAANFAAVAVLNAVARRK
ncbi:MAG: MFS transporter [Acidobacteria bacterium]|nr:MFS transporter [Acidobacteriota bacterium]